MSSIVGRIGEYYPRYDQEPPKLSEDLILPVVLQYVTLFILLEYSFMRGVARGYHTMARAWSLFCLSLVLIGALCLLNASYGAPDHDPILVMRLLRPILLLTVFALGLSVNVYIWENYNVPWQQIFNLGSDSKITYRELFECCCLLMTLGFITLLSLLRNDLPGPFTTLPAYIHPLFLYSGALMLLFSPLKRHFQESRFWFISQVCRVCTPGLRPVGFAEFWLADQACSLVILFVDCEFLLCWYLVDGTVYGPRKGVIPHCGDYSSIRAACSILPAVIRFIQCVRRFQDSGDAFPHLVNAGKYSTTLLKAAAQRQFRLKQSEFNFLLWIASESFSSIYCLWWDLTQDWGLFEKRSTGCRRILRSRILFPRKFYFFAIVEDMVLRFSWALKLVALHMTAIHREETNTILSIAEIFRRVVWNFIRLENEHVGRTRERFKNSHRSVKKLPQLMTEKANFIEHNYK